MSDPASDLRRLQRWMHAVVTHPAGIEAGVSSPAAREQIEASVDHIEEVVGRSRALDSVSRLAVYGNAYFARLLECMEGEFPALAHALGRETFGSFVVDYLRTLPPRSYTLADLGARFPDFLRENRPAEDRDSSEPTWSDLVIDLATLERTFAEVFDGPGTEGGTTLTPEAIAVVPPEEWSGCRLVPVPCLRLLEFAYPVHEYRTAVKEREDPPPPRPRRTHLVVTRRDYVVRRTAVEPEEFRLLGDLVAGRTIGEAVASLAEVCAWPDDLLAERLQDWFHDWAAAVYFERIDRPENE